MATHTVSTTLNYYLPPNLGGVDTIYLGTASEKRRKHQPRTVLVTDIRGCETQFTLDKQGFQVVQHESSEKDFDDDAKIKEAYYAECAALLKSVMGASRVEAVSHVVRKRAWDDAVEEEKGLKDEDPVAGGTSARQVHVDQSTFGAQSRLRDYLQLEEVDRLTRTRWAIVNLWRPFGRPVERENLALADARTVSDKDLRALKGVLPAREDKGYLASTGGSSFEAWSVLPPAAENASSSQLTGTQEHKWYYCSHLRPDEVLVFKQFDSKKDGTARRVPHSAFASEEDRGPPRQSIEVRCFVFWEDQECE